MSQEQIIKSKWMTIEMSENLDEENIKYFLDLFKILKKITVEQLYEYIKKNKCKETLKNCENLETKIEIFKYLFDKIKKDNISVEKIKKRIKKNKELNIIFDDENMKNFKNSLKKGGKKLLIENNHEKEERQIFSPLRGIKS